MDITDALAPTSDQLDAIELVEPRTFTIAPGGRLGNREGKTVAEVALADFPRVWRPSKGMLDVLAKVWGKNGSEWVGRSLTLYNDPEVTFGKDKVGGIRISHMTHIDKPQTVMIRGRGRGARPIKWQVQPLVVADVAPEQPSPTAEDVASATTEDELRAMWSVASPQVREAITARVAELKAAAEPEPAEDADPNPGAPWGGDVA